MVFLFGTSVTSCIVIGFPTVGTHVTGPEKPRQTGDDVVMTFLVEQDQLFVLEGTNVVMWKERSASTNRIW